MKKYHKYIVLVFIALGVVQNTSAQSDSSKTNSATKIEVYDHNKWGFDFGGGAGTTASSEINADELNILLISMNIKRFYLFYSRIALYATMKKNFNYGNQFRKNYLITSLADEFGLGYGFNIRQRFHFIPFVSIGYVWFEGYQNLPDTTTAELTSKYFDWSIKSAFDYVIFPNKSDFNNHKRDKILFKWFARIVIGYNPVFFEQPFKINEGVIYGTIGMGLGFGE